MDDDDTKANGKDGRYLVMEMAMLMAMLAEM